MKYNILRDDLRMVFTIPVGKVDRKKIYQMMKQYMTPIRFDNIDRINKIDRIKEKINTQINII